MSSKKYYLKQTDSGVLIKAKRRKGVSSKISNTIAKVGSLQEAEAYIRMKEDGFVIT